MPKLRMNTSNFLGKGYEVMLEFHINTPSCISDPSHFSYSSTIYHLYSLLGSQKNQNLLQQLLIVLKKAIKLC